MHFITACRGIRMADVVIYDDRQNTTLPNTTVSNMLMCYIN